MFTGSCEFEKQRPGRVELAGGGLVRAAALNILLSADDSCRASIGFTLGISQSLERNLWEEGRP